jgi:predicted lactoylglutathione lyase
MSFARQLFLNLPVRDLEKSKAFFSGLGFTFNPQFTDENAACMVIGGDSFAMLLVEPYFRSFTPRALCDTATHGEALFAVSCASRDEVVRLVDKALATGGRPAHPDKDHGFMFVRTFYDLDGHHWEFLWMDPSAVQQS